MRKRLTCLITALAILFLPSGWAKEYWSASHEVRCKSHLQSCQLLQTVMMGSFAQFDPEDVVQRRVFSSVLSKLCQITESDLEHLENEFQEDDATVREYYYVALANCLWADMTFDRSKANQLNAAQRTILLFLDPSDQTDAEAQKKAIQEGMTQEVLVRIANMLNVSEDFIVWLIGLEENK